jgi:DNA-binding NarL/FixJ family response regulator
MEDGTVNEGDGERLPRYLLPVIVHLAWGKTNIEIAAAMSVTPHTAEKYVSELYQLLGARHRVELVEMCRQHGSLLP